MNKKFYKKLKKLRELELEQLKSIQNDFFEKYVKPITDPLFSILDTFKKVVSPIIEVMTSLHRLGFTGEQIKLLLGIDKSDEKLVAGTPLKSVSPRGRDLTSSRSDKCPKCGATWNNKIICPVCEKKLEPNLKPDYDIDYDYIDAVKRGLNLINKPEKEYIASLNDPKAFEAVNLGTIKRTGKPEKDNKPKVITKCEECKSNGKCKLTSDDINFDSCWAFEAREEEDEKKA